MRDTKLTVLFLNLLRSEVKWKLVYDAETMFVSAVVRKFHNALLKRETIITTAYLAMRPRNLVPRENPGNEVGDPALQSNPLSVLTPKTHK